MTTLAYYILGVVSGALFTSIFIFFTIVRPLMR